MRWVIRIKYENKTTSHIKFRKKKLKVYRSVLNVFLSWNRWTTPRVRVSKIYRWKILIAFTVFFLSRLELFLWIVQGIVKWMIGKIKRKKNESKIKKRKTVENMISRGWRGLRGPKLRYPTSFLNYYYANNKTTFEIDSSVLLCTWIGSARE